MQIFIATNGSSAAFALTCEADASIESVKLMIENQEFVPSHLIRLVNGSHDLEGGSLIGNGIEDEDTLTMLLDVNGGMRKKWRKKRMRRLRRKRRKMRQRAR
jgi:small subunit ribosomal protein S27Ae